MVSITTQAYRLQFRCRPRVARSPIFTTVANHLQAQTLQMELSTLLEKGAIGEVESSDRQAGFFSRYFLIPKKDGVLRPILDVMGVNKYLATIDLKDAYFQVPIWPGYWCFLRFAFEGRIFEFHL